jgi:hypothetical protein
LVSHFSHETIKAFVNKQLPAEKLLSVSDHLAECDECANRAAAELHLDRLSPGLADELIDAHPDFEDFDAYVQNSLEDPRRRAINEHLEWCTECRTSVTDLQLLDKELVDRDTAVVGKRFSVKDFFAGFRPVHVIAATVLFLVAGLSLWLFSRADRPSEMVATANTNTNERPVSPSPVEPVSNIETDVQPEGELAAVNSLLDGGKRIDLLEDGSLKGDVPAAFKDRVQNAFRNGQLEIPGYSRELKGASGTLMGPGNGVPFAIVSPVGKVVVSTQPRFSWKRLPDADVYRVAIFDSNYNLVTESSDVKGTTWVVSKPLMRDKTYSWQVTAIANGVETKSPVRPAPEARFRVIDKTHYDEIQQLRRNAGRSHLLLGIAFANAGMLDDAEREFRILLQDNPNSAVARKLLAKVTAAQ